MERPRRKGSFPQRRPRPQRYRFHDHGPFAEFAQIAELGCGVDSANSANIANAPRPRNRARLVRSPRQMSQGAFRRSLLLIPLRTIRRIRGIGPGAARDRILRILRIQRRDPGPDLRRQGGPKVDDSEVVRITGNADEERHRERILRIARILRTGPRSEEWAGRGPDVPAVPDQEKDRPRSCGRRGAVSKVTVDRSSWRGPWRTRYLVRPTLSTVSSETHRPRREAAGGGPGSGTMSSDTNDLLKLDSSQPWSLTATGLARAGSQPASPSSISNGQAVTRKINRPLSSGFRRVVDHVGGPGPEDNDIPLGGRDRDATLCPVSSESGPGQSRVRHRGLDDLGSRGASGPGWGCPAWAERAAFDRVPGRWLGTIELAS